MTFLWTPKEKLIAIFEEKIINSFLNCHFVKFLVIKTLDLVTDPELDSDPQ
jgi:hypothetical protein